MTVTGVCIGLGEPVSILNGIMEIDSVQLIKQSGGQSANSSMDNEDMMFHMEAVSSAMSEKSTNQTKLATTQTSVLSQKKIEKRIRYYVSDHGRGMVLGGI